MATIDRVKISQEINFNGLPTWIGLEGILLEGEDEKTALRQLQKVITDYHNEEAKAYSQSRWVKKDDEVQFDKEETKPLIEQISSCTELKVLESYRLIAKVNPEAQKAYDNKLKELKK